MNENIEPVPAEKPVVCMWVTIYCVVMAIIYMIFSLIGAFMFIASFTSSIKQNGDQIPMMIQGGVFLLIGLILFILFAMVPFLPRRRWVWTYNLVMICIGLTSCCCLPVCIPILIFWLKPEVKSYFSDPDTNPINTAAPSHLNNDEYYKM